MNIQPITAGTMYGVGQTSQKSRQQAEIFMVADADADGKVNKEELQIVAESLQEQTGKSADAESLLKDFDADGSGSANAEELLSMIGNYGYTPDANMLAGKGGSDDDKIFELADTMLDLQGMDEEEGDDEFFSMIDEDGDGGINQSELGSLFQAMQEVGGKQMDAASVMKSADADGDGSLNDDELFSMMENQGWIPSEEKMDAMMEMADKMGSEMAGGDEETVDALFDQMISSYSQNAAGGSVLDLIDKLEQKNGGVSTSA